MVLQGIRGSRQYRGGVPIAGGLHELYPHHVVRHAEKPDGVAGDPGLDERGLPQPAGLTLVGWQRAGALVSWFAGADLRPGSAVSRPHAIFAAADTPRSQRPRLTVTPVARALGLGVDTRLSSQDEPVRVKEALLAMEGVVLVCWRHRTLPALAAELAGASAVPVEWPDDRFDLVWVLDAQGDGWRFTSVSQSVLPGDDGLQGMRDTAPAHLRWGPHHAPHPEAPRALAAERSYRRHSGASPAPARSHILVNKVSSRRT